MKTTNPRVVVAQSHIPPDRLQPIASGPEGWQWLYFGKDVQRFYEVKQHLGNGGRPLNSGAMINQVAQEIRAEFINFDQCLRLDNTEVLWQTTDLAEKNPYISDFFYNCCAYITFRRVLDDLDNHLTVFVEDWFLGWQMTKHAQAMGFVSRHFSQHEILDGCPDQIKYLLYRVRYLFKALGCRVAFVRKWWQKRQAIDSSLQTNGLPNERCLGQPDVLLTTWATPTTFQSGHVIGNDTYYGGLPELLRQKSGEVGYIAHPATWLFPFDQIVENVHSAKDAALLPEECVGFIDVLRIALSTLFKRWSHARFELEGIDLTELLKHEILKEKAKSRQCRAMQFYYIGRCLSESEKRPRLTIYPYENQPWEKGLRLGIKHFCPETKVIGYQHTPFPPLYLGYFPSDQDLSRHQIPDQIIASGAEWRKLLLDHGYPSNAVVTGAAVRFQHVLEELATEDSAPSRIWKDNKTVLVATSIGYTESFELVYKTIEAFHDSSRLQVLIKFHPKMGRASQLITSALDYLSLKTLPEHIRVTEQPISDLLPSVRVLLFNFTSVAYEALAFGIPALFVESDIWFDMNKLAWYPEITEAARTPAEIRQTVYRLLNESEETAEERQEKARVILKQTFSPIQENTLQPFLEFDSCAGKG